MQVDETALQCVLNAELRTEWQKYLEDTGNHVRVLTEICEAIGGNPNHQSLPDAPSFTRWELHLSQR